MKTLSSPGKEAGGPQDGDEEADRTGLGPPRQDFDALVFSNALRKLGSIFTEFHSRSNSLALRDLLLRPVEYFRRTFPAVVGSGLSSEVKDVSVGRQGIGEQPMSALLRACLAISAATGIRFAEAAVSTGSIRSDFRELVAVSRVRSRLVTLRHGWWKEDGGPLLAFRKSGEAPVALIPAGARRYKVYDPATSAFTRVDQRIAEELDSQAYAFLKPFPTRLMDVRSVLKFGFSGSRMDFRRTLLSGLAGGVLALAPASASIWIVDNLLPAGRKTELLQAAILLLACALAMAMFSLTRSLSVLRIEGKMDFNLQTAAWERLLGLPAPFFRKFSSGDLALRSLGISEVRRTLTSSVVAAVLSLVFSAISLIFLFWLDWRLAILANVLVLSGVLISIMGGMWQLAFERPLAEIKGRISGLRVQLVNGIAKIRMTSSERRAFAYWAEAYYQQYKVFIDAGRVATWTGAFSSVFPLLCVGVLFFAGGIEMKVEHWSRLSIGGFIAFLVAFTQYLSASVQFSTSVTGIVRVVPLYERLTPILHNLPEVRNVDYPFTKLRGGIELQNVSFRYDSGPVLANVTLRAKPGEFVALAGPSGCGKSTSLRLLLGFEKPESGEVFFDDQDLNDLNVELVRRQMGVVLQNGRVMTASILENIVGSSNYSIHDAWEAAALAALDNDIREMPMGMQTLVGEGGIVLSAGQRQRLMIARAVIGRPPILLLDEATSALDNRTQSIVIGNLERLKVTRIVVAQRLSTIVNADRIYVMERGSVVQEGPYSQLIKEKGLFRDLAARQIV